MIETRPQAGTLIKPLIIRAFRFPNYPAWGSFRFTGPEREFHMRETASPRTLTPKLQPRPTPARRYPAPRGSGRHRRAPVDRTKADGGGMGTDG